MNSLIDHVSREDVYRGILFGINNMNTRFWDALEKLTSQVNVDVKAGVITESAGKALLVRFIHGPIAAALVRITPNPYDDILLEIAKQIFPKT